MRGSRCHSGGCAALVCDLAAQRELEEARRLYAEMGASLIGRSHSPAYFAPSP
jgi:hypothetical protein